MTLAFYFDERKCSGCRTCQVACKDRNDYSIGLFNRHVFTYETGEYPDAVTFHFAKTCNHCENPACVANCPVGAMVKDEVEGVVLHDDATCIGCGTCVASCPYQVPMLDEEKHLAVKCDSCKALRDAGQKPVCVNACLMRALDFGDVDELRAKYGDDLVSVRPYLPASETNPPTLVKPKKGVAEDASIIEFQL